MPGQSSEAASTRALYNQSQELEGLQRVFDGIDKNNDKKVDVDEMHDTIRRLGYKCSKKEVADMMWEARRRSQRWRSRTPRPAIDRLCAPPSNAGGRGCGWSPGMERVQAHVPLHNLRPSRRWRCRRVPS